MKRVYHLCPATPCILCVCACMRVYEIAILKKKRILPKALTLINSVTIYYVNIIFLYPHSIHKEVVRSAENLRTTEAYW